MSTAPKAKRTFQIFLRTLVLLEKFEQVQNSFEIMVKKEHHIKKLLENEDRQLFENQFLIHKIIPTQKKIISL